MQNQGEQIHSGEPVTDRLDMFWLEKNKWKAINGGCEITPDVTATLTELAANTRPPQENLAAMVRSSVERKDAAGRTLEQIWAEKIAEGATHVGILDGVFHFFKGEEILQEQTVPLEIPVAPPLLQLREEEHKLVSAQTHVKEVKFHDDNAIFGELPGVAGGTGTPNADDIQKTV